VGEWELPSCQMTSTASSPPGWWDICRFVSRRLLSGGGACIHAPTLQKDCTTPGPKTIHVPEMRYAPSAVNCRSARGCACQCNVAVGTWMCPNPAATPPAFLCRLLHHVRYRISHCLHIQIRKKVLSRLLHHVRIWRHVVIQSDIHNFHIRIRKKVIFSYKSYL
jgi:hypothetical protein